MSDILDSVIQQFRDREALGLVKYGTTVDRDDLTPAEWCEHAKLELMDAVLYLEALRRKLDRIHATGYYP